MSLRTRRVLFTAVATTLLSTGLAAAVPATAQAAGTGGWRQEAVPLSGGAQLSAVAYLDADTVWAVGDAAPYRAPDSPLLVARDGDGHAWHPVATPLDGTPAMLTSISAASARDVWITGVDLGTSGTAPAAHWDGRRWLTAPVPTGGTTGGGVHVAAVSPHDAWAAGWHWAADGSDMLPVLAHWNGASWTPTRLPAGADVANFVAVKALAADDVWAVGFSSDDQPRALHFDGRAWAPVPVPFGGLYGELGSLAATGPDDVWAGGRVLADEDDGGRALLMHWDGRSWQRVAVPAGAGGLDAVAETGSGAVVATGESYDRTQQVIVSSAGRGSGFRLQAAPELTAGMPMLGGAAASGEQVTLVGAVYPPGAETTDPVVLSRR